MKISFALTSCFLLLTILSGGCNNEPQTLREEAEQARENLAETREEATELVDEAQEDAVDNLADARQDAKENIADAKQDAENMVESAEAKLDEKLDQLGDPTLPLEKDVAEQPSETPTVGEVETTPAPTPESNP